MRLYAGLQVNKMSVSSARAPTLYIRSTLARTHTHFGMLLIAGGTLSCAREGWVTGGVYCKYKYCLTSRTTFSSSLCISFTFLLSSSHFHAGLLVYVAAALMVLANYRQVQLLMLLLTALHHLLTKMMRRLTGNGKGEDHLLIMSNCYCRTCRHKKRHRRSKSRSRSRSHSPRRHRLVS